APHREYRGDRITTPTTRRGLRLAESNCNHSKSPVAVRMGRMGCRASKGRLGERPAICQRRPRVGDARDVMGSPTFREQSRKKGKRHALYEWQHSRSGGAFGNYRMRGFGWG